MVQRLPNPPLVTDSMSSGGEVHDRLSMSGPGSTPISPMPQDFEMLDLGDLAVNQSGPDIPVSDQSGRDHLGRFTQDDAGPWKSAGSDGAGWHQVGRQS
jgi:hypothetical protein